jgi:hypothetical protein
VAKTKAKIFSEVKRVFEWFVGLFASYTVTAPVLA